MLIQIPWTIPHVVPKVGEMVYRVSFPEEGAVVIDWRDPEGKYHGSWGLIPYDIVEYPGVYWGHSGPSLKLLLPKFSPFHVVADYGLDTLVQSRWQSYFYGSYFPSFFGQADNVDQILEYGEPFVSSPYPFVVTIYESPYYRKSGPYIGAINEADIQDPEEVAVEDPPQLLHFHFHLLGFADWREKIDAVKRLMIREIGADIDVEEIESASLTPWRQQLRRRLEERQLDLETEERRIRGIFEEPS